MGYRHGTHVRTCIVHVRTSCIVHNVLCVRTVSAVGQRREPVAVLILVPLSHLNATQSVDFLRSHITDIDSFSLF